MSVRKVVWDEEAQRPYGAETVTDATISESELVADSLMLCQGIDGKLVGLRDSREPYESHANRVSRLSSWYELREFRDNQPNEGPPQHLTFHSASSDNS